MGSDVRSAQGEMMQDFGSVLAVARSFKTDGEARAGLGLMSNDGFISFARAYVDVRYLLMQAIFVSGTDASEDTIEDVADWLIQDGSWLGLDDALKQLPARGKWGVLSFVGVFYVLDELVAERFGDDKTLYGVTGHPYPYPWTFGGVWHPNRPV